MEEWDLDAEYEVCLECKKLFLRRNAWRTLCRPCDRMLEAEDAAERESENKREEK